LFLAVCICGIGWNSSDGLFFSVATGRNSSGFTDSTWLHMFEKTDVLQGKEAKSGLKGLVRLLVPPKNADWSRKKSFLFFCLFIRYHNTREVATHKIRNTVTHGSGNRPRYRGLLYPQSAHEEAALPLPFQD